MSEHRAAEGMAKALQPATNLNPKPGFIVTGCDLIGKQPPP